MPEQSQHRPKLQSNFSARNQPPVGPILPSLLFLSSAQADEITKEASTQTAINCILFSMKLKQTTQPKRETTNGRAPAESFAIKSPAPAIK
jgi:hypothetical protein